MAAVSATLHITSGKVSKVRTFTKTPEQWEHVLTGAFAMAEEGTAILLRVPLGEGGKLLLDGLRGSGGFTVTDVKEVKEDNSAKYAKLGGAGGAVVGGGVALYLLHPVVLGLAAGAFAGAGIGYSLGKYKTKVVLHVAIGPAEPGDQPGAAPAPEGIREAAPRLGAGRLEELRAVYDT